MAEELLTGSELFDGKRYAVYEGRAYCAQEHGADVWHGYPVGWSEVPRRLRTRWKSQDLVRRRDIKRNWD